MNKDLTYEEQYDLPVEIILSEFGVEYYTCGSHQLRVTGKTELENLQNLYDNLKILKGIVL